MDLASSPQEPEPGVLALDGLAPITIFVGANNSGKSRLLRELFRLEQAHRTKLGTRKSEDAYEKDEANAIDIGGSVESWLENLRPDSQLEIQDGWIPESSRQKIDEQLRSPQTFRNPSNIPKWKESISKLNRHGIKDKLPAVQNKKRCYVPMLRGMRPPTHKQYCAPKTEEYGDLYKQRTVYDYFHGQSDLDGDTPRSIIFTGLGLYGDLRSRLLAKTQTIRDSVRKYELFLSKYFFAGKEVILIPVEEGNNDVVHIRIGNNDERPIYDLGDGMQSLIICTYPIVTETEPGSLFFLEEPDLCMHPSLQRTFLEVLKTYHRRMGHQFFITTHSNHLLDLLEDNELVSIFSFSEIADWAPTPAEPSQVDSGANSQSPKPKPSFRIRPSNLKDRQTLLELGVRPSATYLANATIWVEGVSDCAYLRAYMEAFVYYLKVQGKDWGERIAQRLEQYKEDRHYAFVEYSGSNLEHYSFKDKGEDGEQAEAKSNKVTSVTNLCARAIVIADGDIGDNGKGDRKESFAAQLGDRFIWLPGKEIENMIPEALMREQVRRDNSKIETISPGLVDEIRYEKYCRAEIGVGAYLSSLGLVKPKYEENGSSGTLSSHMKGKWASNDKGIPWLVRQDLKRDNKTAEDARLNEVPPNAGNSQSNDEPQIVKALPRYLTQDLIWLCVCLYVHIAKCNHDQETKQKLKELQQFIKGQGKDSQGLTGDQNDGKQPGVESDKPAESAVSEWPIKDVEHNCLLTAFLDRTSRP
jgi:predicted ATPase